jgi:hypothetical protein
MSQLGSNYIQVDKYGFSALWVPKTFCAIELTLVYNFYERLKNCNKKGARF